MFEFTPFGLMIVAVGFIYLYFVGRIMVPARRDSAELEQDIRTVDYLSDVRVTDDFSHLGETLKTVRKRWMLDIEVLFLFRGEAAVSDKDNAELHAGDILRIRGGAEEIDKLVQRRSGLEVRASSDWKDADITRGDYELLEAVISPDSDFDGRKIKNIAFAETYEAVALGVYKRGRLKKTPLPEINLRSGDSILLASKKRRIRDPKKDNNFVIVSDVPVTRYKPQKAPIALAILAGVVLSAALGLVPIVVSACTGVVLMVFSGCMRSADIYRSINWKVIFLLAGVIPLGVAMQETGAARLMSDLIVQTVGHLGPRAVLSGYFLLTTLLTAMISNQATAAILASLAIETAVGMEVSARPFLMAVTFAASLSLITPWGYQTNTLIYGPGRYRFTDFTKIGAPLNLLFWGLGTVFIPVFWPF